MNRQNRRRVQRINQSAVSRRQFLGRSAALGGGLVLGPSFLAACGSDGGGTGASGDPDAGKDNSGGDTVRISNWPLYIEPGFNDMFESDTGLAVDYDENFQDNETWFAANKDALAAGQDIGADMVVPTNFMTARLIGLGWLAEIDHAMVPNIKNLRPDLMDGAWDPGAKFSLPYMSGLVGLAYNKAKVGRELKSIDDLWDPEFKGKVSMFSDMQDGLGMIMLSQGKSLSDPSLDDVKAAADLVAEKNAGGQIRRFTGNDYADDLTSGNVVIAQVYSGDVAQLQEDNADLEFFVPEGGGTTFVDTMCIPITGRSYDTALKWMDYVYDKENYAKLIEYVQYIPVLSDMSDALDAIDPELAANPLINPPQDVLDRVEAWGPLEERLEQDMVSAYADVTGG